MELKFIEDKDFDLSSDKYDDLLGTKPYAETLFEVVKKSRGKQNIGLFGGWGSGKSTIIRTLESFIVKNNEQKGAEKIAYYKYDAWKYSNDDFRRSFIKNLNIKYDILKEDAINTILYQETTTQNVSKTKAPINFRHIFLLLGVAIILLLVIGLFVLPKIENDDIKSILVLVSLLATFLFYLSKDFFRIVPFTIKQSRLIEPERFEETFHLIISKIFGVSNNWMIKFKKFILSQLDYKKMVIVIDNLDRCDNENLKETLSTVKNFLETENVIFIIPVDENGITSFLNGDNEDAEEYLRKIFHQIIRLKKFTPDELVDFTNTLNEKFELDLSKTGIRLICQEFTTNPRKIIQFLNNLQTERDLIKRQVKEGYINLEYNKQADDFLIKLLIIKQEWNELYRRILDDINLLNKVNEALRNDIQQRNEVFIVKIDGKNLVLNRDQKRFFKRNREVHFNYLEPFILNIDRQKDVPDELRAFIENGELKNIFKILSINSEEEIEQGKVELILGQIERVFDYNSNKFEDYDSIALPISEILFELTDFKTFRVELEKNLKNYTFIKRIFSNNRYINLIPNINNFDKFCSSSLWFIESLGYQLPYLRLSAYLKNIIKSVGPGFNHKTEAFLKTFKFKPELISSLQQSLEAQILNNPPLLLSYPILLDDFEVIKHLFSQKFIDNMLEKLNKSEIEDENTKKALIGITSEYIENDLIDNSTTFSEYVNYQLSQLKSKYDLINATPKGIFTLNSMISEIIPILPKCDKDTLKVDENFIQNIYIKLSREYTSDLSEKEKSLYISFSKLCFNYMKIEKKFATSPNIDKYLVNFFTKDDNALTKGINEILQELIKHYGPYNWSFFNQLVAKLKPNRSLNLYKTLILMYDKTTNKEGLSEEQRNIVIENVFSYFFYWQNYPYMVGHSRNWFESIFKKDKESFATLIEDLNEKRLEFYVYNVYKLKSEKFILTSFKNYLEGQTHYKKFEKFIRHVNENHTPLQLESMLKYVCTKNKSRFDWFFSSRKLIVKSVFNKIISKYITEYSNQKENTKYLNNLLKLNKSELYIKTRKEIIDFISNLKNTNKLHRNKISKLKSRFN